jgi:hypothetical protein
MGTDITLFAERFDGGEWRPVPPPREEIVKTGNRKSNVIFTLQSPCEIDRPYNLFSVLSGDTVGLRNRGLKVPCISEPRGAPPDTNPLLKKLIRENQQDEDYCWWGLSWLLVSEFLDFGWDDQRVYSSGFVRAEYADLFQPDKGFPEAFPENGKLYSKSRGGIPAHAVEVGWSESMREFVGCYEDVSESLIAMGPPEETRIVYWFDS